MNGLNYESLQWAQSTFPYGEGCWLYFCMIYCLQPLWWGDFGTFFCWVWEGHSVAPDAHRSTLLVASLCSQQDRKTESCRNITGGGRAGPRHVVVWSVVWLYSTRGKTFKSHGTPFRSNSWPLFLMTFHCCVKTFLFQMVFGLLRQLLLSPVAV